MTGIGKRSGGGDTLLENRRSGKPLFKTPGVEAERLAKVRCKASRSWRDKNRQRPREMISSTGATPLTSSDEGLVAGNVTGGGGKATKKRPNGTGRENVQTERVIILGADRSRLSAEEASGYKIGGSNVYMREPPNPLTGHFGEWIKKNKSVETSNRDNAFVLFKLQASDF